MFMSEKIRKGNVFNLKTPITINENQHDFTIPAGTTAVVIGPTISSGNKVTHIQLNAVSPSGAIIDLKMAADSLLEQFERGRVSRDKTLDDWSVSVFTSHRLDRHALLSYKGEEVADIYAIKEEGVERVEFKADAKKAQNALTEFLAQVNKEVDEKHAPLNFNTFGDYYFKGFNLFLSLEEYAQLLSQQKKIQDALLSNHAA